MAIILSSGKRDFILDPVWTNVTGMLGFSDESISIIDLSCLGALVTNPISLNPRTPAHPPRVITYQGGFLLHTGHPNPGLSAILRKHQKRWKDLPCPVIVHLLGQDPYELSGMVERLEEVEAVAAIEVGLDATDADTVSRLTLAALQCEQPVVIQVPLNCNENIILAVADSGANAISLGPPRGSLPGPGGEIVSGRLFGPALFPVALQAVVKWTNLLDIPIIASGGIYDINQVKTMLAAGASAVQLDSILWTEPDRVLEGGILSLDEGQNPTSSDR